MDDPCYYGFPVFGEPGPKVAQDAGGKPVTADTRTFDPDRRHSAGRRFLGERYLPQALGPMLYTKTCLYTLTPDRDFVIDTVPGAPGRLRRHRGGHAFKFASVIGRILSRAGARRAHRRDLSAFGIDRPILKMKDPPINYMV